VLNNHNQRLQLMELDTKRSLANIDLIQKYINFLEKRLETIEKKGG